VHDALDPLVAFEGPDARSGRVEVDVGSRQHPAFDDRSTVSRGRREPREPSERPRLAGRGLNFLVDASRRRFENAHSGRDDDETRVMPFRAQSPDSVFVSSTSLSSDCAGSCLDSSCLLRSDRDPSRTRAPAKGRRGVERVEVLSIGGLEFARAGRIPRLSRVGDLSTLARRDETTCAFSTSRLDSFAHVRGTTTS